MPKARSNTAWTKFNAQRPEHVSSLGKTTVLVYDGRDYLSISSTCIVVVTYTNLDTIMQGHDRGVLGVDFSLPMREPQWKTGRTSSLPEVLGQIYRLQASTISERAIPRMTFRANDIVQSNLRNVYPLGARIGNTELIQEHKSCTLLR
jgi:hypothetical protein